MMRRPVIYFAIAICTIFSRAAAAEEQDWSQLIAPDVAREDLAALYDGLKSGHYDLYIHRPKPEYDALYQQTMASLDAPLSRFEFFLAAQKFTAFGNVAHARIDFPSEAYGAFREAGGRSIPIFLRIVDGRAYVGEDYSGLETVSPGDEILSIDGRPMSFWLEETAKLISADTPYIAHSLLEFSFPMYLWAVIGEQEQFEVTFAAPKGKKRTVTIPATTRTAQLAAGEGQDEQFALDFNGRESRMLDGGVAYLRPGPFYNVEDPENLWDATQFTAFIDDAFASYLEAGAQNLIIDLRDNPGGDNSFSDPMIAWIADRPFRFASKFLIRSSDEAAASNQARLDASPGAVEGVSGLFAREYARVPRGEVFEFEIPIAHPKAGQKFTGEVYVLVNRHSYSNAVNVAAIFQDYGWGVIAGEKTSDMATTYGAMESFTLVNSGFSVGFPKAHIIRPSGEPESDGVTPDVVIETPIVAGKDDAVLKALLKEVENGVR
ncbi:S41 family peptidase [Hyphococcus sp.]|uniref:S41 family peptidase n=1 Tax=Hyphococcus sp. TaxID=2038636 RepID=UPI00208AB11E|nr:MAG: hypothetical protein DHS20C04_32120 [Marinicaulis sp.]